MKLLKHLILFLFIICAVNAFGYQPKRTNNFSSYNEHTNEIGYAINFSYLKYERTFSPQLHLHYSKYFTDFFATGFSYGGIYDKHFHNNLSLDLSFRIYHELVFTIKPGLAYMQESGKGRLLYSMGFQTNYEFKISDRAHIGPMLEIDALQDDVNFLAGFHMGFTF